VVCAAVGIPGIASPNPISRPGWNITRIAFMMNLGRPQAISDGTSKRIPTFETPRPDLAGLIKDGHALRSGNFKKVQT